LFVVSASVVGADVVVARTGIVGGFARLARLSDSVSGNIVNTQFGDTASLNVVLATFGRVARIDCAIVAVVAVERRMGARSVDARVYGASVEVIAVDIIDSTSLSTDTSLRLAKIGSWASLVCARAVCARVQCTWI